MVLVSAVNGLRVLWQVMSVVVPWGLRFGRVASLLVAVAPTLTRAGVLGVVARIVVGIHVVVGCRGR